MKEHAHIGSHCDGLTYIKNADVPHYIETSQQ